jgi:hypothetical protein
MRECAHAGVLSGIGGGSRLCVSDGVSEVHRDELHGWLQFEGGNAKFLYEDVMDCVASKCRLQGSEQGVLKFLDLCLCGKVSEVLGGKL